MDPSPTIPSRPRPPALTRPATPASGSSPSSSPSSPSLTAVPDLQWNVGDLILGTYEITGVLGQGGMGRVYRARHRGWDLDLAVKVPLVQTLAAIGGVDDFEREAETWVNLGLHPHTVVCHYIRRVQGVPCLFAEFVNGGSLHDWIYGPGQDPGPLYRGGPGRAFLRLLDLGIQFAYGLAHAHGRGLVHRDVKPANVLVTKAGLAKVTDFGLAMARPRPGTGSTPAGSSSGSMGAGTPPYFSPEQAAGRKVDQRSDLWAWALSILEMLQGERTWEHGAAARAVLDEYLSRTDRTPWPAKGFGPLTDFLKSCFQDDPNDRPSGMGPAAQTLAGIHAQTAGRPYPRRPPDPGRAVAEGLNNRAVSFLDLGRTGEAMDLWDQARATEPHHPEATYNQGLYLWRAGSLADDALLEQLAESLHGHPDTAATRHLRAWVHLDRQDGPGAREDLGAIEPAQRSPQDWPVQAARLKDLWPRDGRKTIDLNAHDGALAALWLHPDGSKAVSGGQDGRVRLWDLESGRKLRDVETFPGPVRCLASLGGGLILAGGGDPMAPEADLRVVGLRDGRVVRKMAGHQRPVNGLDVSADRRLAASGGDDRTVRIWDLSQGSVIRVRNNPGGAVTALRFLSPEHLLAVGDASGRLTVWDAETGSVVTEIQAHEGRIHALAWDAARRRLASVGSDRRLRIQDADGRVRSFDIHRSELLSAAWAADGLRLGTGGGDAGLRLWDPDTGRVLRTFQGHETMVLAAALNRDGSRLVSGDARGRLIAWRWPRPEPAEAAPYWVSRIRASEDVTEAGQAYGRDVDQARQALAENRYEDAFVRTVQARRQPGFGRAPEAMALWRALYRRLPRGRWRQGWESPPLTGPEAPVKVVQFGPEGDWIVSLDASGVLFQWDLANRTGRPLPFRSAAGSKILAGDLGGRLVWAGPKQDLLIWAPGSDQPPQRVVAIQGTATALGMDPLGRRLFYADLDDHVIHGWDLEGKKPAVQLKGHRGMVNAISLGLSGRMLLSGGGDHLGRGIEVILWDLADGRPRFILAGHERAVEAVRMHPDGRTAFSGGADGRLLVWNTADGTLRTALTGHQGGITALDLSPDGRLLVSGGSDGTIRLWDWLNGEQIRVFEGRGDRAAAVRFGPDGGGIAGALGGPEVHLWMMDWNLGRIPQPAWDKEAEGFIRAFIEGWSPASDSLGTEAEALDRDLWRTLGQAGWGWLDRDRVRALATREQRPETGPKNRTEGE